MIAEILSVGTELLLGQITNTNARFLATVLAELGIDAYSQQVVGDNRDRLAVCLRTALARSDLVITTGGLGPTEDDLTKEVVSEVLGLPLSPDPTVAGEIRCLLERHGSRPVERAVAKQSLVPEGAVVLRNPVGTAPGLLIVHGSKRVALLPGPPAELEPIVRLHLVPLLEEALAAEAGEAGLGRSFLHTRVVKITGLGEPAVEEAVRDLIHSRNPTVAPLVTLGEVHLRVTGRAQRREEARHLVEEMAGAVVERLASHVFGYDDDTLAGACGRLLRRQGLTLALAESVTGGLLGHLITETPGSSDYFDRGLVVYSNAAKTELLGVEPAVLNEHGAVSEEVAVAMARGMRQRAGTDIGLALTGIAGPSGATPAKAVGLVYIALAGPGAGREPDADVVCLKYVFSGERTLVKRRAAHNALTLLWKYLRRCGEAGGQALGSAR
jgi:nicotinamide-nucleotide amidase